jgi:hypothetical protein
MRQIHQNNLATQKRNRLFSYAGYIEIISQVTETPGRQDSRSLFRNRARCPKILDHELWLGMGNPLYNS